MSERLNRSLAHRVPESALDFTLCLFDVFTQQGYCPSDVALLAGIENLDVFLMRSRLARDTRDPQAKHSRHTVLHRADHCHKAGA